MQNTKYLIIISLLLGSACSVSVFSPPTLGALDQGASPLRADQTAVTGTVTQGNSGANPDTSETAGRVEVARGINDRLQLSAEVAFSYLSIPSYNIGGSLSDGNAQQFVGRVAAKTPIIRADGYKGFASNFMVGVGAGHITDAASLASFDAGVNLGYQNCVLTPTAAASYYFSAPFARKEILARQDGAEAYDSYELPQTNGVVAGLGLTFETSRAKCMQDQPRFQVRFQSEYLGFYSADDSHGTGRVGLSLRYRF